MILQSLLNEELLRQGVIHSIIEYPAKTRIIQKGTLSQSLYIVKQGKVKVILNEENADPVISLGENECVGEYALFDNLPASADVITETDVKLLQIDIPSLRIFLEKNPAFGYKVSLEFLRTLIKRLRHSNQMLSNFYTE